MQEMWAHQLVHGYQRGHRLLAGSTRPRADDLRLIDRLSDAAGVSVSRSTSGYLTGYPLPSGDYALAKTWPAPAAERPNVVWTHTLILPSAALSAVSLQPLASLFTPPFDHSTLTEFSEPVPIGHLSAHPPFPLDDIDAHTVVAALYWGVPGVWLAGDNPQELCLALWSQQWPRLRRSFSFCSEAFEARHLDGRAFDLLFTPHGRRVKSQDRGLIFPYEAVKAVEDDLKCPGPLRDFLRTCGSDSGRISLMALLAETWVKTRNNIEVREILGRIEEYAPKPNSLRRLKRSLLRNPSALLRGIDAAKTFELLSTDIGECIFAEDASVDVWANRAWSIDRQSVIRVAERQNRLSGDPGELQTAARVSSDAALLVVAERAHAADLGLIAAWAPPVAAATLAKHREPEWWDAWAALLNGDKSLGKVAAHDRVCAELASAALLRRHLGADAWKRLQDDQAIMVGGLLAAAAAIGEPLPEEWGKALGSTGGELAAHINGGLLPAELGIAADAVPYLSSSPPFEWLLWKELGGNQYLWRQSPVRAAVVLVAALGGRGEDADSAVAATYEYLHQVFSTQPAADAWRITEAHLPGHPYAWDRCRRLEAGVIEVATRNSGSREKILSMVGFGKARDALAQEMRRQSKDVGKHARNNR